VGTLAATLAGLRPSPSSPRRPSSGSSPTTSPGPKRARRSSARMLLVAVPLSIVSSAATWSELGLGLGLGSGLGLGLASGSGLGSGGG
jgi:hypothetical protein